ncbi:hypothetical protein ACJJTC_009042 [Scirpophaga incertulas]
MEEFVINVDDDSDVSNDSSSFESEYEDSSDCDEAVPSTSAGFSNFMEDQGVDLEFLMAANDHELLTLVPGIINEGMLRIALDQLKESKNKDRNSVVGTKSNELFVATPQRTAIITSSLVTPPVWELQEWGLDYEEALASIEITTLTKNTSLKSILEKTSIGKPLLSKQILTTRYRKVLTALIVEAEVRKLKNVTDPIRKEAWDKWTSEITTLFPTETKAVYY